MYSIMYVGILSQVFVCIFGVTFCTLKCLAVVGLLEINCVDISWFMTHFKIQSVLAFSSVV